MMAGHTMLKVFGSFVISLGLLGGWLPLSFRLLNRLRDISCFSQAYVFAILTHLFERCIKSSPLKKEGKWS